MGHIGINVRPDQTYKEAPGTHKKLGPVLSDVNFRHAMLHVYNQEEIVASIYKYIVTPVRSLVPPALGGWVNPEVEAHPYNPGDPTALTQWDPDTNENDDACSILRYGGYTYSGGQWTAPVDLDGDTLANDVIPGISLWTPTYEVAPTSAEHGARFSADANAIGVPVIHAPREFSPYLEDVFGAGDFDMYMVFWSLGRFPDHLYDMTHTSQDCAIYEWRYNGPGIRDPALDAQTEIVKFSLDHEAKLVAAYEAQRMLYDFVGSPLTAGAYLQLYSRIYFNAFQPGLKGIVNSPGYGSDTGWTFFNMRWEPGHPNERIEGGESVVIYCLGEEPERMNPTYAHTVYAWEIMGQTMEDLLYYNPYTLEDVPWLAKDWEVERWATDTEVAAFIAGTYPVKGSDWTEDYPARSKHRKISDWIDTNGDGVPSKSDYVKIAGTWYHIHDDPVWDIKIENATFCMPQDEIQEMKLHNIGNNPPDPFVDGPMGNPTLWANKLWHELWPNYSTAWTVIDWQDNDASGTLTRSDYIKLDDGCWYHVDSVTVTLALDEEPEDTTVDKYIEFVGTGSKMVWLLREDVFWQDGNPYTAEDAKFNLLFMRDNQIPRYTTGWEHIVDVDTVPKKTTETNEYVYPSAKFVVYLDITSQFLLYDIAGMAALLPPPVWERWDDKPMDEILGYDPSTNTTKPDGAGPWFGTTGALTQLYGTGPFVFEFYDPVGMYGEVTQLVHYWKITDDIFQEKVEMFHRIGDVDRDGEIGIFDLSRQGIAYFTWPPNPLYDPDADINNDGIIDISDIALTSYFYGGQREYP